MKTILIKYADIEKLIVKNNKKPTKKCFFYIYYINIPYFMEQ